MTPEQYKKLSDIKAEFLPTYQGTPTQFSCAVESIGKDRVLEQECYRKDSGCYLCYKTGVTCEFVMELATIHDGLAPIRRKIGSLKGDGPGFAG